jgi:tetratricopeptide (TPR) repeat protein
MVRGVSRPASLLAVLLLAISAGQAADDRAAIREAVAALERGDFLSAEQKLRAELQAHPNNAEALSLLGVALDSQRKFREADEVHRRAVVNAPGSADVLSNYGNHLSGAGDEMGAREAYLKAVALDAAHRNANLELARLALKQKNVPEALPYLNRLPPYSAGMALARAGQYEMAETFLAQALAAAPGNFGVLYNLGVAASYAGHNERAHEVLETALRQQPKNVDVLYSLAYVEVALKQKEAAARRLAQAAQLAPQRADIQKLLAIVTGDLGALADSMAAWDRYLKLEPNDDSARRERGFTAISMGQFEQGMAELEWFLARHPDDAVGHYELGLAQSQTDPAQALIRLDKAVALKKDFVEARSARGVLHYRQGKPEAALTDLEFAAALRPDDALNLDRLGQTYLALDRPADAVRVLRRAAELAPEDSRIQLHFGRALADAGQPAESKVVMDRFRQLGPSKKQNVPAGLVEYLSLTPEQQRADYRARVEKAVRNNPSDAGAQVRYLQVLLEDGNPEQAAATARRIAGLKPGAAVLAGAGRTLLVAKQYALAKELLEAAAAADPSTDLELDLAIASFHAGGAIAALQRLERVPESQRSGDYYLARAQMLDASGRSEDALSALDRALEAAPKRPDLYQQAAAFLTKNGQASGALRLLDQAARNLPQNREILLMKAATLELAGQTGDAERLLNQIQNRWPEWHAGWVARGIILGTHKHFEEARQALETAVALGARSPEAYSYLAECTLRTAPKRMEAAEKAIRQALKLAPDDPWVQSLAGRIAFAKGEYATAVERQREAIRLRPGFVQAHQSLAQAYTALGRKQEAQAELERVRTAGADDEPSYLSRLLRAKPPRDW